jgi:hypothetical protein
MSADELTIGLLDAADPEYEHDNAEAAKHPRTVVLIIYAPKEPDPKRFRFRLDETVGKAATHAAHAFHYEVENPSFQAKDETVLDRTLTLEAAGVHSREVLELVDAGGGV